MSCSFNLKTVYYTKKLHPKLNFHFPSTEFIKKSLFLHLKRLKLDDDDDESFISFLTKSSNVTKNCRRTLQHEGHPHVSHHSLYPGNMGTDGKFMEHG